MCSFSNSHDWSRLGKSVSAGCVGTRDALRSGSVGAALFLGGVGAKLAPLPPPCTLGTLYTLGSTGQPPSLLK